MPAPRDMRVVETEVGPVGTAKLSHGYASSSPPTGIDRFADESQRRSRFAIQEWALGAWIMALICGGAGVLWAYLTQNWWFPAGPILLLGALGVVIAATSMSRIVIDVDRQRFVFRGSVFRSLTKRRWIGFDEVDAVQVIPGGTIGTGKSGPPKPTFQVSLVLPVGSVRTTPFRPDDRRLPVFRTVGEDRVVGFAEALAGLLRVPMLDGREVGGGLV